MGLQSYACLNTQAAVQDPTLLTVPQLAATVMNAAPLFRADESSLPGTLPETLAVQPFKVTAAWHGTTVQGWPSALRAVEQFASLQDKADAHRLASPP
jgi:hypothetical protein